MADEAHLVILNDGKNIAEFNEFKEMIGTLDLSQANLQGLNLAGADFSDADLSGADLSGANLTGAKLAGAKLVGTELINAKGIPKISLQGHSEHGKTCLVAALAKTEYDDKDRAVLVMRGDQPYVLLDSGSQDNRLKQLKSPDVRAALLVVSAPDGLMGHATEAVEKAAEAGIRKVLVFLNKVDLMDDAEVIDLVVMEVEALLEKHGFPKDGCMFRGSAFNALQGKEEDTKPVIDLLAAF